MSNVPMTQQGGRKVPCHEKNQMRAAGLTIVVVLLHAASFLLQQELLLLVPSLANSRVKVVIFK